MKKMNQKINQKQALHILKAHPEGGGAGWEVAGREGGKGGGGEREARAGVDKKVDEGYIFILYMLRIFSENFTR